MQIFFYCIFFVSENYMPSFNPESSKLNTAIEILLYGFFMSILFTMFCAILLLIYDPTSVVFFGALVPLKYYSYFPIGIVIIIYHTFYILLVSFNLIYTVAILIVFILYSTVLLTKEMSLTRNSYKTLNILRTPQNMRVTYRAFQILFANLLCFAGPFLLLGHGFTVMFPIFCNFVLIRYWNVLKPISKIFAVMAAVMVFGFWTFVLQLGKYLSVRGNKTLESWKRKRWNNHLDRRIMQNFQKSCRLVLIRCGNQLVLGRITQFNFVKAIMRGTFRSLLTSK